MAVEDEYRMGEWLYPCSVVTYVGAGGDGLPEYGTKGEVLDGGYVIEDMVDQVQPLVQWDGRAEATAVVPVWDLRMTGSKVRLPVPGAAMQVEFFRIMTRPGTPHEGHPQQKKMVERDASVVLQWADAVSEVLVKVVKAAIDLDRQCRGLADSDDGKPHERCGCLDCRYIQDLAAMRRVEAKDIERKARDWATGLAETWPDVADALLEELVWVGEKTITVWEKL